MSNSSVTPIIRRKATTPKTPLYEEIESAIHHIKCTLACASVALGKAQDESDIDLAAKSWWVINGCAQDLERLADDLERWHMRHEHSPKAVAP